METIEFRTKIKNGMIQIPAKFKGKVLITLHKWVLGDWDRHRLQPKIGQGSVEIGQARSTGREGAF